MTEVFEERLITELLEQSLHVYNLRRLRRAILRLLHRMESLKSMKTEKTNIPRPMWNRWNSGRNLREHPLSKNELMCWFATLLVVFRISVLIDILTIEMRWDGSQMNTNLLYGLSRFYIRPDQVCFYSIVFG